MNALLMVGPMTTPNTTTPLQYWKPGDEERQLRVFISHRYGDDRALYDGVIDALNREVVSVQDVSLTEDQRRQGPQGGRLPRLTIQAEIAARIYSSDVFIAPARVAAGRAPWLTWEIQLAAVGYGLPILFVKQRGQIRSTQLVADVAKLELPHRVCDPDRTQIVRGVTDLVSARPRWGVRMEETDEGLRFRGPTRAALDAVMKVEPYHPKFANLGLPVTPKKHGIFRIFRLGR